MEARHGCVRIQDTLRLCFKENNENPQPNFYIFYGIPFKYLQYLQMETWC